MYEDVQVHGETGQPVILLPGGHVSATGFYPGFVDGLIGDPGARVILYDRPGTGNSVQEGTLAEASDHLHGLVQELGMGPVVVVGQSLGGAVALLFARDYPADVAGLVLLDATPINDAQLASGVEAFILGEASAADDPEARAAATAARLAAAHRIIAEQNLEPDYAAAMIRNVDIDMRELAASVQGLGELASSFSESDLPREIPAAVISADYPEDADDLAACMRAHESVAQALGAPLLRWPGATHAVHLDHPVETLDVIRDVTRQAAARR